MANPAIKAYIIVYYQVCIIGFFNFRFETNVSREFEHRGIRFNILNSTRHHAAWCLQHTRN